MNGSATRSDDDHRAHRGVRGGQALRRGDDVRHHVEALDAEVVAEPAPGADHLVGDQQHVVLVADLAHALPVAVLRHEAAARVLHRLEDHRGHGLRALELDHVLDLVGGPERVAVLGPAVLVRVGHVVRARARAARTAVRSGVMPGDRERAEGGAVVGGLARDDLRLRGLPVSLWYWRDSFQADSTASEPPEVKNTRLRSPGASVRDALGQLDRRRVRVAPVRVEAELLRLRRRGLAHLGAPVAGVHAEERREAVEVALVVLVVDVGALAAHDDRDLVLLVVRPHAREVHPEMAACLLLELARSSGVGLVDRLGGCGHCEFSSDRQRLDAVDNGIGVAWSDTRARGVKAGRCRVRHSVQLSESVFGIPPLAVATVRP